MLIQTDGDASWATETVKRLRQRCRDDLLFLTAEILGEAGVEAGLYEKNLLRTPSKFHYEAATVVEQGQDALILAPRIHLKTALVTVGGGIQSVLRDSNWRNLLISETPTLVSKVLREIVWHFRENKRLRNIFPEYRVDGREEDGTKTTFDVPCRKGPAKDYSFEAIGVGGATAGGHFDTIRATDILSNRTVPPEVTEETMLKTWNFIRGMGSLLDRTKSTSHTIVEGTVWNGADAYCQLRVDTGYRHWKKVVYGPWAKDETGALVLDAEQREIPLWPEAYTREKLLTLKGELGDYLWSCNFENDPMPAAEDRLFLPSYFKHYAIGDPAQQYTDGMPRIADRECPACGQALDVQVTGDLAISQAKTADWTALPVSGVCPYGHLVVLDIPRGRWTPYETVSKLYELDAIWKPSAIGIESVAWQKAMVFVLHEEAKKEDRYPLPIWEMKPDNSPNGKLRRISMLAAYAASRGVWVRDGDHDALVDEALRMSRHGSLGGHDDLVDALGYRVLWMQRPDAAVIEEPEKRPLLMGASAIKGSDALAMLSRRARGGGHSIS